MYIIIQNVSTKIFAIKHIFFLNAIRILVMIKANWIKVFASQAMHQNVLMPLYGDYMRGPIYLIYYIEIVRCEFECERKRERVGEPQVVTKQTFKANSNDISIQMGKLNAIA